MPHPNQPTEAPVGSFTMTLGRRSGIVAQGRYRGAKEQETVAQIVALRTRTIVLHRRVGVADIISLGVINAGINSNFYLAQ
jgi:hypothetical protein